MSKQDVLKAFKSLHRVAQTTFQGDNRAIEEARKRINLEFRKKSEQELEEKLKVCREVEMILKHQVVQAVKSDDRDVYELKLRKETTKLDNKMFKDDFS